MRMQFEIICSYISRLLMLWVRRLFSENQNCNQEQSNELRIVDLLWLLLMPFFLRIYNTLNICRIFFFSVFISIGFIQMNIGMSMDHCFDFQHQLLNRQQKNWNVMIIRNSHTQRNIIIAST